MRTLFGLTLAIAMFAVAAAQVQGQEDGKNRQRGDGQGRQGQRGFGRGGPGGPPGGGGIFGLLGIEEVRKEIEVLDEQLDDIKKLGEKLRAERPQGDGQRPQGGERRNFQDLSEAERAKLREEFEARQKEQQARQREQNEKAEAALAEILLPHQMDRLKELGLQRAGIRALASDEVAAELGLSDDNQKKIGEVFGSMRERMGALFGRGEGAERPSREEMMAKFQELNKQVEKEVLATLTESQREKFAAMKGEPFEFPPFQGFGGGRPGGGNRDGQGQRPQRPADNE